MSVPSIITTVLTCTRGDTASWDVAVVDQAGDAVNLTGATSYFTLRDSEPVTQTDDTDSVLQVSSASGIEYTTAASGLMRITLTPAQTRSLSPRSYFHELQVIDGGGSTYTPASGILLVRNEQTRRTS